MDIYYTMLVMHGRIYQHRNTKPLILSKKIFIYKSNASLCDFIVNYTFEISFSLI